MICPTCNEHDVGQSPWPSWYRCGNCDVHPETSLHMKEQRERIAALEAKLEAMEQFWTRMDILVHALAVPQWIRNEIAAAQEEKKQ